MYCQPNELEGVKVRAINKQGHHPAGERVAAMTVRYALRNLGVREFPGNLGGWRNRQPSLPSADNYAIRLLGRFEANHGLVLKSSNDARIEGEAEASGYVSILPIEHSSAISYISSCRPDHRLIYVSPQISRLGFAVESLLDKLDLRLMQVHEEDMGRFERTLQQSCNTAEKFSCHYRLYDNSGKVRWFHDEASVVCDETGAPMFIKGVMLDITDRKHLEAELNNHRYFLERNVALRTEQLMRRLALLESCNASLCEQLSCARMEIASLRQQLDFFAPEIDHQMLPEQAAL